MKIDMITFNRILKAYMTEVKILEKTKKKEAIPHWIKICKFIVDFAKKPQCPITLRPKLIKQAETILAKVKQFQGGQITSIFNSETVKTAAVPKSSGAGIPFGAPSLPEGSDLDSDDAMLAELSGLSVPQNSDITPKDDDDNNSGGDEQTGEDDRPGAVGSIPPPVESSLPDPLSPETLSSIEALERELKQMPSNMTEIAPAPLGGGTVHTNLDVSVGAADLNEFKKDTQTIDITQAPIEGNSQAPSSVTHRGTGDGSIKIGGFVADPLKSQSPAGDASNQEFKGPDPFGPSSVLGGDGAGSDQRVCFACGNSLKMNEKICPLCEADNS